MIDYESYLKRWQSAGVLDAEAAARIRLWETAQQAAPLARVPEPKAIARESGLAWQGRVALILGGILLASGIVLFVSFFWVLFGLGLCFVLVLVLVSVF